MYPCRHIYIYNNMNITLNRSFNVKSGDENKKKKKTHDEAYPNKH